MTQQYYRVGRAAMEAVMNAIYRLPYREVAGLVADVQRDSSGPYDGPARDAGSAMPPAGAEKGSSCGESSQRP